MPVVYDFYLYILLFHVFLYSGRKITESLGNVTVRGEKKMEKAMGSAMANSLSEHA
jgi:hypothetical protein